MVIFDIFKKKKSKEVKEKGEKKLEKVKEKRKKKVERPRTTILPPHPPTFSKKILKAEKKVEKEIPEKAPISAPPRPRKKETGVASLVLKSPQITEKASFLEGKNQYVFKVFPKATKLGIKKAIEEVYGVRVVKVRTITVPRRQRRLGNTQGWSKGYKKAIVKIKEGQKIEIVPR